MSEAVVERQAVYKIIIGTHSSQKSLANDVPEPFEDDVCISTCGSPATAFTTTLATGLSVSDDELTTRWA